MDHADQDVVQGVCVTRDVAYLRVLRRVMAVDSLGTTIQIHVTDLSLLRDDPDEEESEVGG